MTLRVLSPGLCSLVVDFGRPNHRSLGVPVGGAADRAALAVGNALVGNAPDVAALEITLSGPTLRAECQLASVVYGAPFEVVHNAQPLAIGRTLTLEPGDELRVGGTPTGMRAYLCVRGGIQTTLILGSRSALEPLAAGASLSCLPGSLPSRFLKIERPWEPSAILQRTFGLPPSAKILRVLPGPERAWFDAPDLFPTTFDFCLPRLEVTSASNRMGIRLRGEPLRFPSRDLVSEPVCPGTVQVTRDGQCIILGVDGQTIGGYPKIAQVISADLDEIGQLSPGDRVHFIQVEMEQAEALFHRKQAELHELLTRLRATAS